MRNCFSINCHCLETKYKNIYWHFLGSSFEGIIINWGFLSHLGLHYIKLPFINCGMQYMKHLFYHPSSHLPTGLLLFCADHAATFSILFQLMQTFHINFDIASEDYLMFVKYSPSLPPEFQCIYKLELGF